MNNATDLAKIKDRIAKLLRMSKDCSSPEEAAIAAGRARKLMDEYQISEFEAGTVTEQFAQMRGTLSLKNFPKYMEYLAVQTCKLNDCQAVYSYEGDKKYIEFRGYASDVQMAVDMYKSLLDTCQRLAVEYLQANGYKPDDHKISATFKEGAVSAINMAMRSMLQERKALAMKAGNSLVVFKEKAVEEKFGKAG